jgi:hypothetical protein
MRINGVTTDKAAAIFPAPDKPLTFKRGDQYLAFLAQPVWNFNEFHALCPLPENNNYRFEKGGKVKDPDAPAYQEALANYGRQRWGYMVLKSLEPSNIEWDNVSLTRPKTWGEVETELKANLSFYEFAKVMELVDEANALDERKLEDNAQSFFQMMRKSSEQPKSGQPVEAENSSSTAPASDSE